MGKKSTRSNKENDSATANKFGALAPKESSDDESDDAFPDMSDLTEVDFKKFMMKRMNEQGRTIKQIGRSIKELQAEDVQIGRSIKELQAKDVQIGRRIEALEAKAVQRSRRIKNLEEDNMLDPPNVS